MTWDYSTLGLTLRNHSLELLRPALRKRRLARIAADIHVRSLPGGDGGPVCIRREPHQAGDARRGRVLEGYEDHLHTREVQLPAGGASRGAPYPAREGGSVRSSCRVLHL